MGPVSIGVEVQRNTDGDRRYNGTPMEILHLASTFPTHYVTKKSKFTNCYIGAKCVVSNVYKSNRKAVNNKFIDVIGQKRILLRAICMLSLEWPEMGNKGMKQHLRYNMK